MYAGGDGVTPFNVHASRGWPGCGWPKPKKSTRSTSPRRCRRGSIPAPRVIRTWAMLAGPAPLRL